VPRDLTIAKELTPALVVPLMVMQIGNRLGAANRLQTYQT
jgi:hypothetical protein